MFERLRICVTGVGGDLGQAIVKCLRLMPEASFVLGVDADAAGVGALFPDSFAVVPLANDSEYIPAIKALLELHKVDVIIPGSEPEIFALSHAVHRDGINLGVPLVCQAYDWLEQYGDKLHCYESLAGCVDLAGYADGTNLKAVDELIARSGFPCVVKSRNSSGSKSLNVARSRDAVVSLCAVVETPVVQGFIDDSYGEFSVGVFRCMGFSTAISFKRDLGGFGASWYADSRVQHEDVIEYSIAIAEATNLEGSCNVQVRKNDMGIQLLEINPRFSSLVAARAACGFKDLEWSVRLALGLAIYEPAEAYLGVRFRRYFHEAIDYENGFNSLDVWEPRKTDKWNGKQSRSVRINGRLVGPEHPVFIIAEMSANHNQDISLAKTIIKAAHDAGADAIKIQTYTPDTITLNCDNEFFRIKGTLWEGRNIHDLYSEAYTPWEWHASLKKTAEDLGLVFFSTPFDHTAVDFLEELDVPCHKIASFEMVDLPLIRRVAMTGKPVIMSTGMASEEEIEEAISTFEGAGGTELVLLKCTSAYPAPSDEMHLRTIPYLAERFRAPVGISDHTLGSEVPFAAVALGACVVEKHFCLNRADSGPDSAFSLEPKEFKAMVEGVRKVERALGKVNFELTEKQRDNIVFRRSLFVVKEVRAGEKFTSENVRSIRPGHGLHTRYYEEVIGKKAVCDIERGTPLSLSFVSMGSDGDLP